jgi:hypothetical protein
MNEAKTVGLSDISQAEKAKWLDLALRRNAIKCWQSNRIDPAVFSEKKPDNSIPELLKTIVKNVERLEQDLHVCKVKLENLSHHQNISPSIAWLD